MPADTSDVYGPFSNEELVGRAIKGVRHLQQCTGQHPKTPWPRRQLHTHTHTHRRCAHVQEREQYTIATKCGIVIHDGAMRFDGSRAHVRAVSSHSSSRREGVHCLALHCIDAGECRVTGRWSR